MRIKGRKVSVLCFGATFLVLAIGAQSAAADTTLLTKLSSDGANVCTNAASISQAARDACTEENALMGEYTNSWPTLYGLSQEIASTLDIGWQNASWANRQTYATDILKAVETYSKYVVGTSPCRSSAGNPTYYFCAGLATGANPGSGATAAYDDNAWIGTDLLNAYRWSCQSPSTLSGGCNAALLSAAEGVFNFEQTGLWKSTDACPMNQGRCSSTGTLPTAYQGGIYFDTTRNDRGEVANADAALFASELAQVDKNLSHGGLSYPYPLGFANYEYGWVRNVLGESSQGGSDPFPHGLFWNHLKPDGCFTDNQTTDPAGCGTNIGDPVQSYGVGLIVGTGTNFSLDPPAGTPASTFLTEAEIYAVWGNKQYFDNGDAAPSTPPTEADFKDLEAQCPAYDAVYFHYLSVLNKVTGSQAYNTLEPGYISWLNSPADFYFDGDFRQPWNFLGNNAGCGSPIPNYAESLVPEAGATRAIIDDALPSIQIG